jgi:hypothetical protein
MHEDKAVVRRTWQVCVFVYLRYQKRVYKFCRSVLCFVVVYPRHTLYCTTCFREWYNCRHLWLETYLFVSRNLLRSGENSTDFGICFGAFPITGTLNVARKFANANLLCFKRKKKVFRIIMYYFKLNEYNYISESVTIIPGVGFIVPPSSGRWLSPWWWRQQAPLKRR